MSRTVKTVTADGSAAGGSTGLTTAEVNTLIQAKNDWEYLGKDELTAQVSTWRITEGIDKNTYDEYKFVFENVRPSSSGYYNMSVRNTSGTRMNIRGISHALNTSYAYSQANGNDIYYFYASTSGIDNSSRMKWEIEISVQGSSFIQGYTRSTLSQNAGYWQHITNGGFIIDTGSNQNAADHFAEIEVPFTINSGVCYVYGRRIRS